MNFYLDPTHKKLLPHKLLGFPAEHSGFKRIKIIRIQEPSVIHQPDVTRTQQQVFYSVIPVYTMIAQKSSRLEVLNALDHLWEKDYGVTLPELTNVFKSI